MNVWMVDELARPSLKHADEPELGPKAIWIVPDVLQRAGRLFEEQFVTELLMTAENGSKFLRHGEGDHEGNCSGRSSTKNPGFLLD